MKKHLLVLSVAALGAVARSAAAESAPPPRVDELIVTATRSPERADRIGAQVTVVSSAELRELQTPVLSDVLARVPGVSFSRNGGVGSPTQVYLRGAEPGHTLVLIDGVRLNDPTSTDTSFNFANLLVGDLARIEVLRGPQSVLWGSQAIGGVVNLISAEPQKPFEADATAEGGSHAWGYGRVGVGGAGERVSWRLNASALTTRGISAFDAAEGGREPDGYRNLGASGKARVRVSEALSLDLRAVYSRGRDQFDGFPPPDYVFGDTPEYSLTEDLLGYAGANLDLLGGRLRNRIAVSGSRTGRKSYDPTQSPDVTFSGLGRSTRVEYQGDLDLTPSWALVFGAERERSHMRSASSFSPTTLRLGSTIDALYLQAHGEVAPGVTIAGGVRRDHHDAFGGHTVGQASLAWRIGGASVLRASWGQGFKAPSLYQLGSEYGNLGLRPETANGWDAGFEQRLAGDRIVLNAAYFERRTQNQIDFVSCYGGPAPLCPTHPSGGYYDNVLRARARGVELSAQARLSDALTANASYTWTDARNDAPQSPDYGRRLARRPSREASADLDYVWPQRLSTGVSVRYAGDRFDDAANLTRVKGSVLWDLRAAYPLTPALELYGRVENLFDRHYETVRDYGELGRTAYAGVRARF